MSLFEAHCTVSVSHSLVSQPGVTLYKQDDPWVETYPILHRDHIDAEIFDQISISHNPTVTNLSSND
jgi:hypothetical protein